MGIKYYLIGMVGIWCFSLHGSGSEECKGRRSSREEVVAALHEIQTPRRSKWRAESEKLTIENRDLLEKNKKLQALIALCTSQDPTRDISFTQGYIEDLSLAKDQAEKAYKDLETRHVALEKAHTTVKEEYGNLQQQVTKLQAQLQRQQEQEVYQHPCSLHIVEEEMKRNVPSVVCSRARGKDGQTIGVLVRRLSTWRAKKKG